MENYILYHVTNYRDLLYNKKNLYFFNFNQLRRSMMSKEHVYFSLVGFTVLSLCSLNPPSNSHIQVRKKGTNEEGSLSKKDFGIMGESKVYVHIPL